MELRAPQVIPFASLRKERWRLACSFFTAPTPLPLCIKHPSARHHPSSHLAPGPPPSRMSQRAAAAAAATAERSPALQPPNQPPLQLRCDRRPAPAPLRHRLCWGGCCLWEGGWARCSTTGPQGRACGFAGHALRPSPFRAALGRLGCASEEQHSSKGCGRSSNALGGCGCAVHAVHTVHPLGVQPVAVRGRQQVENLGATHHAVQVLVVVLGRWMRWACKLWFGAGGAAMVK